MDSNYKAYSFSDSLNRLAEILGQSDLAYEEVEALPDRNKLTFSNGFYGYCSALFIDIRKSSEMPKRYKRPTLARIYRAYISEMVAIMNGDLYCREINIVGDGVWCVVNTPRKTDIDDVFSTAARCYSLVKTLNVKLTRRGLDPIEVGLGLSYGRALMIKAGQKGSTINDVVYMGDVVNEAAKLAAGGSEGYFDHPMMVSDVFYGNLNDHNKGLLSWHQQRGCWHGNVINTEMEEWWKQNRA